jgi:hypothetical protein
LSLPPKNRFDLPRNKMKRIQFIINWLWQAAFILISNLKPDTWYVMDILLINFIWDYRYIAVMLSSYWNIKRK